MTNHWGDRNQKDGDGRWVILFIAVFVFVAGLWWFATHGS